MEIRNYPTVIWYTFLEGYRSRIVNIKRDKNPHYDHKYPELKKPYYEQWFKGLDLADKDVNKI